MAESIVSLAVRNIGELLVNEVKLLYGVKDKFISMQEELMMMHSFLLDMEALNDEVGDERPPTIAKEIRRIAYEVEDVIDTYILEANPDEYKKSSFKRYLCFCKGFATTRQVGTDIKDIITKIAQTMVMLKKYGDENGLKIAVKKRLNKNKVWRPAVYAQSKEDYVVGLDEDINYWVRSLTTDKPPIDVLSIVGMGGCGKTTLVRKLYNHENVKQCFDSMAWVTISRQWVFEHVLLEILEKIFGETMQLDEATSRDAVCEQIFTNLKGRKYLIVLDDVCARGAFEEICSILPFVHNGSKIIVTTRYRDVTDGSTLEIAVYEPRRLTAEESWELFEKKIVSSTDPEIGANFKALGKEMLKTCKGLPLAIVALAGILARKKTFEEWERVQKNMSSGVIESGRGTQAYGGVDDMLALSYNDLPHELKPCFLYMGLFPEDCQIPAGMLVRIWIAEGFISSNNLHQGETLEDLAMKYLEELIGRCVVQVADRNYGGRAKTIEIHNLMRDLCIRKAKEQEFLEILYAGSSKLDTATQPRRTIVHSYNDHK